MSRPSKPVNMQTCHLTKDEIESRSKAEQMLKSSSDKVYNAPVRLNKATRKIYTNIVENLRPLDILSDLDIDLVCVTADALYQMEVARKDINENGQVIHMKDKDGNFVKVIKNPSVEVFRAYENIFRSSCGQLCMSPSSRAKLSAEIAAVLREEKQLEEDKKKQEEEAKNSELAWLMGGNNAI